MVQSARKRPSFVQAEQAVAHGQIAALSHGGHVTGFGRGKLRELCGLRPRHMLGSGAAECQVPVA